MGHPDCRIDLVLTPSCHSDSLVNSFTNDERRVQKQSYMNSVDNYWWKFDVFRFLQRKIVALKIPEWSLYAKTSHLHSSVYISAKKNLPKHKNHPKSACPPWIWGIYTGYGTSTCLLHPEFMFYDHMDSSHAHISTGNHRNSTESGDLGLSSIPRSER